MLPFSVLRMWMLGLLGWIVLGVGGYLVYDWTVDAANARVAREEVRNESTPDDGIVIRPAPSRWPLIVGLLLIALSVGGALPVLPFLGRPPLSEPHHVQSERSQRIQRPDGTELYVEHYGRQDGPTLILTHGWSLNRTEWYYAIHSFGDRYHLVLWDLAGHGQSSAPRDGDLSLEKMAGDLESVIRDATQGPVILMGHSIGGMIQQTFCRLFPQPVGERVQGMIFVHTTYINPVETAWGHSVLKVLETPVLKPLNHLTIWLSPLVRLSNWQSYCNGTLHIASRLTSFAGTQTWGQVDYASRLAASSSPAVVARGNLAMTAFDERQTLPGVHIPCLVISGRHDRMTRPQASHTLVHLLPQAREVELAPAGHLGHWEQSAAFDAAVTSFVDSLDGVRPQAPRPAEAESRVVG